jgi:hypothetical protein
MIMVGTLSESGAKRLHVALHVALDESPVGPKGCGFRSAILTQLLARASRLAGSASHRKIALTLLINPWWGVPGYT